MKVIDDGNLVGWVCSILISAGLAVSFVTFKYAPPSIWSAFAALFGFLLAAVGGVCSRARMLHIKPFDNGYKKARDSYQPKTDKQKEAK